MTTTLIEQTAANLLGLLALVLLLPYLDRLRLLHWRTHQAPVVGMHVAWALWLGWCVFDGTVRAQLDWQHLPGVLGAGLWLAVSRPTWRGGPPEHVQSAPMPLHDEHDAHGAAS